MTLHPTEAIVAIILSLIMYLVGLFHGMLFAERLNPVVTVLIIFIIFLLMTRT